MSSPHWLFILGINRSPPSSLSRVLGRELDILFSKRDPIRPFGNSADGGDQSWPFRAFPFRN
ncbi:unnamed protein product [Prunus armeniaca]